MDPRTAYPDNVPPLPRHPELGAPTAKYAYRDGNGALLGYVLRFDPPSGKEFRPCTFCRHPNGTLAEWRWQTWPTKRPIYNRDKIQSRPSAPILICEGEKAADAAAKLALGFVTTTSPGGAKAGSQADWRPLRGRSVVIWPDADGPGAAYAKVIAKHAAAVGALDVKIITPPTHCPEGWDAADALAEDWDEAPTARLISLARSPDTRVQQPGSDRGDDGKRRRAAARYSHWLRRRLRVLARRRQRSIRDLS